MSDLRAADLRLINLVAARRFAADAAAEPDRGLLDAALADLEPGSPQLRAASLAAALLQRGAFSVAPLQSALLVMHCALALDGLSLLAPQGVAAGMVRELAAGGDVLTVARWLEDRAVPAAGG